MVIYYKCKTFINQQDFNLFLIFFKVYKLILFFEKKHLIKREFLAIILMQFMAR